MSQTPKDYLLRRIGRPQAFPFRGVPGRWSMPDRRDYSVTVRGMNGLVAIAEVTAMDVGADGKPLLPSPRALPSVHAGIADCTTPAEALEEICRTADPEYFAQSPRAERSSRGKPWEELEVRIASLSEAANRADGEAAPAAESVERFRAFRDSQPLLILPDVFSSREGALRARWQDGHDRSFWLSFAPKGPLGWTCSVPRKGDSGFCRINGRCIDDRDIPQAASSLGVRITR